MNHYLRSEVPVEVATDKLVPPEAWLLLKAGRFALILCDEMVVTEFDSLVEAGVLSLMVE